jgi:hypothetical protein
MKASFTRNIAILALGLIAACVAASPASAQDAFKGSFTLPNEVRWGNADLPAGHYTFTLKSAGLPAQIIVTGPKGAAFVMTSATNRKDMQKSSCLTIEHRGGQPFIKDMYLADLQLQLNYPGPSLSKNVELAKGPVSTEQILIAQAK